MIAAGILNLVKIPVIPGMEDFEGKAFHSGALGLRVHGRRPDGNKGNMTNLADKVVAVVGTGASAIQILPPLAESAKHVYVFQRTPSAIGVRDNRPTPEEFAATLAAGLAAAPDGELHGGDDGRCRSTRDLVDDGWTAHMAKVSNPRSSRRCRWTTSRLAAEEFDFEVMEEHRRRIEELVADPDVAEIAEALLPVPLQAAAASTTSTSTRSTATT